MGVSVPGHYQWSILIWVSAHTKCLYYISSHVKSWSSNSNNGWCLLPWGASEPEQEMQIPCRVSERSIFPLSNFYPEAFNCKPWGGMPHHRWCWWGTSSTFIKPFWIVLEWYLLSCFSSINSQSRIISSTLNQICEHLGKIMLADISTWFCIAWNESEYVNVRWVPCWTMK